MCFLLLKLLLHARKTPVFQGNLPPVSIVICARNEAVNLQNNLPFILSQNYPDFEVIIVDDGSKDTTQDVIKKIAAENVRLKLITISPEEKKGKGKKFALRKGAEAAQYNWLLFTDADCKPASDGWIRTMISYTDNTHEIVLGISPYTKEPGILNALIEYETAQTALQYCSFALSGHPYMSVGRNVCYEKSLFLSGEWTAKELSIASGDDDLAIQKLAGKTKTAVALQEESYTISIPGNTWKSWVRQKLRHYEPGKLYRFSHRLFLGSYLLTKILLYVFFVFSFITAWLPASLIFFFYGISLTSINFLFHSKLKLNSWWYASILYDPLYSFSTVVLGIISMVKPSREWK